MSHPEKILVVQRAKLEAFFGGPIPQGHIDPDRLQSDKVLSAAEFRVRDEVEDDPTYKQIISYTVLTVLNKGLIFSYRRGAGGGEGRLHGLRSLGVGGHVDESDAVGSSEGMAGQYAYSSAVGRELDEEIAFVPAEKPYDGFAGYINDDSNAVGAVHLGFVREVRLATTGVTIKETSALVAPGFVAISSLASLRDRFETWSQILIDKFWSKHA
jgi:predicted NUDIX family phosphoesterase